MNRSSVRELNPPLRPRRGDVLKVLGVARISTDHQDEKSLGDQEALYRRWLDEHFAGPYELSMIATRGSGERVDREELTRLEKAIDSQQFDLILAEDLGRIARRIHAVLICEACEDNGTRLIALNDSIDTGTEDWRLHSFFASMRHETYNRDTSKRIRRTQRNRFMQGGVLRIPLFCYHKPPGAKHDSELQKKPEMIPIVEEMVRLLEDGASYSEVADYLNENKIPLGLGSRAKRWSVSLVRNVVCNPLMKGVRVRNKKMSVRINKTGRRKSIDAPPEELLERAVPHLAFLEPARFDRLIAKLRKRNEIYSVPRRLGYDPRKGRPKKRTTWPGQQVFCGICRRLMVYGGHGQTEHLMCNGARSYECWNGFTFDARLGARKMSQAIFEAIAALPEFDKAMSDLVRQEAEQLSADRHLHRKKAEQQVTRLEHEASNLLQAIRECGTSPILTDELRRLQQQQDDAREALMALNAASAAPADLPSAEWISAHALEEFQGLALESQEFARLMNRLIPRITAFPVRLCDGGRIDLRARFTLDLTPLVPAPCRTSSVESHLRKNLVVDLFNMPQRAKARERVVALRAADVTEKLAAQQTRLTITAAQRAVKLQRLMDKAGLSDPYLPVTEPPTDYPRLKRHLHKRYRFNPLPPDEDTA